MDTIFNESYFIVNKMYPPGFYTRGCYFIIIISLIKHIPMNTDSNVFLIHKCFEAIVYFFKSWYFSMIRKCRRILRENWMIYIGPGFLAVVWFGSSPNHSPPPPLPVTSDVLLQRGATNYKLHCKLSSMKVFIHGFLAVHGLQDSVKYI